MADINAKDVMKLRNKTGLAMMACKKALIETGGDFDAAEDLLRKQLKGKMDTRTERAAGEGKIAIATSDGSAAIVELLAETDFTARNEKFTGVAQAIAEEALNLPAGDVDPTDSMKAKVDDLRISTGENISLGRAVHVPADGGTFGSYIHHDGKTGVLIQVQGNADPDTLRKVCMHITAAMPRPLGVTTDDIPSEMVEKEKKFRLEQAMESGKPQEIAEKIVDGGMRKFYSEVALLEQDYVLEPGTPIKDVLKDATVVRFFRWEVGEAAQPAEAAS